MSPRSSYPDRREGEDDGGDEELPDQKTLECDEETLELTLPSGQPQSGHKDQPERRVCGSGSTGLHQHDCCSCVSGAKIGHRSLMRYYKQRFGAERAVVPSHNRNAVGRVLRQYRALGWGGEGESCSFNTELCLSFRVTPVSWVTPSVINLHL